MGTISHDILGILDRCCNSFTFPMLDNGYVYLAATRLSLFRSHADWALVIEVFGFSPRAGLPDTHIYTFGSSLHNRKSENDYVTRQAYDQYLVDDPNNESRFVHPIAEGSWQDDEDCEVLADGAESVAIRGHGISLPGHGCYVEHGIELEEPPAIFVHEACRYLAAVQRDLVLATTVERRGNLPAGIPQIMQIEEWHHPDVVDDSVRPSGSETFQQLAVVLETGDTDLYQPSLPPNTHWSNWPDGGQL